MSVFDLMAADAAVAIPKDDQLAEVGRLANEQLRLEKEVEAAEKTLKSLQADLREVSEIKLPELLTKIGLPAFTLNDGSTIEVKPEYHCGITDERREPANNWLRQKGHGDLIKNQLAIDAGRGDDDRINSLVTQLEEQGFDFERKESVHSSTLKAFVKEQIERELLIDVSQPEDVPEPFPRELFGVHVRNVTKIKKGKKK